MRTASGLNVAQPRPKPNANWWMFQLPGNTIATPRPPPEFPASLLRNK